jgi:CDGSH-type Zn-finger protein
MDNTDDKSINKETAAEVTVQKNGPILIKGRFRFRDSSGKITEGEQELYLCRCGGSASMPWCDDTHKRIGVPN